MPYLAMADADRVQDYVFLPSQLRYVRGASALQTGAIQKISKEAGSAVLYANGGVVLAKFADKEAAGKFGGMAERTFREETVTATVSVGVAEYDGADFLAGWQRVQDAVERVKRQRNGVVASGSHWLWASCERCGSQPAQELVDEPGNANLAICQTCLHKWNSGRQMHGSIQGLRPPTDFEELAELSQPGGYLALLYIDLDRLGNYFQENIDSEENCKEIATEIDAKLRRAVREAGRRAAALAGPHEPAEGKPRIQPWLELLVGGDDCILMLAAHLATDFLRFFEEEFQFRAGLPQRPWFSAGIVFAHHQLPIGDFVKAAKGLCRQAKRREGEDSAAFQVVTSSMADNVDDIRKPTANPYSLEGFLHLRGAIGRLKQVNAPRSKMHRLYETAWQNQLQGQLEYMNLLIRLPTAPRREMVESFGWDLWKKGADNEPRTFAADLVELWEFVYA
jgi:hypothetical protein